MTSHSYTIQRVAKLAIVISILVFMVLAQYFNGRLDAGYSRFQLCNGLSLGHFMFFFLVGIVWPGYIWQALAIGIWFEFIELVISSGFSVDNRQRILHVIGGRFPNHGFKAPTHWLDRLVLGEYPTDHWWHPKVTDVILNAIGFLAGRWFILHAIGK